MASEVYYRHDATAKNVYFTIRNTARQMWNTAGTPNFEALTVANWGDYDIVLTETPASSYFYVGTFPAISGNMVAGWYFLDIFERAGASPAIGDTLLASYFGYWDGTTFKFWGGDTTHIGGTVQTAKDVGSIALSSGKVTVGTNDDKAGYGLTDDAITAAKIASDAITSAKIQDGALTAGKFAASSLNGKGDWNVGKTAYKLAADGLDSITATAPTGVATNFREMIVQVWRRFFKKAVRNATAIETYADDGTTVLTEQAISDAEGVETQGAASNPE